MEVKQKSWKERLHDTIFESNTPAGKTFDIALLIFILSSIIVVILDSIPSYHERYGNIFLIAEWTFTILFTLEYILRLVSVKSPLKYAFGFLGLIDLLTIVPMYLSFFIAGAPSLLVLRVLRLLRVFRIFKLTHFLSEMSFLGTALKSGAKKISIFMLVVLALVIILGSIMYMVEGRENGFRTIPESIYWAIVTITTVGYGDITPMSTAGKFIASVIMLIGYSIIAVPTGIITTEIAMRSRASKSNFQTCPGCGEESHNENAKFCMHCGEKL